MPRPQTDTMPDALDDAIREAYATARTDVIYYDTLEIRNPAAPPLYLVQDRADHSMTLETGQTVLFKATAFRFILPATGDNGVQELGVAVDNTDQRVSDFIQSVIASDDPVKIIYRPYLSDDLSKPQMNPPLVLFLTDIVVTAVEVTGRAAFADILNRKFLSEMYSRRRFPTL